MADAPNIGETLVPQRRIWNDEVPLNELTGRDVGLEAQLWKYFFPRLAIVCFAEVSHRLVMLKHELQFAIRVQWIRIRALNRRGYVVTTFSFL